MQEQFHESSRLSLENLRSLQNRTNKSSMVRFVIHYGLLLGAALIIVLDHSTLYNPVVWWTWSAAFLVFGLMVMSMFALGHETVHRSAFESPFANELVCWLACLPIYYVPEIFRQFHFAHHRHTHEPGLDPEISMGGKKIPSVTSKLPLYLLWLSGLPVLFYKVAVMSAGSVGHGRLVWQYLMPYVPQRAKNRVRWESRAALCFHVGYGYAAWQWLPGLWNILWAQWLGHAMLAVYLTTEHNGLPHTGSAIERTRTMLTNRLIKFLMWNMPYHAEHHAYPAVPWHALPKLHQQIQDELKHTEESYLRFHSRVLSQVSRGKAFQEAIDQVS